MPNILKHKQTIFFVLLLTLPFLYLAYKYFQANNLQVYDAAGHLGAIWYLKNYLWPNFTGWNPFSLLGFDQGLLYPMLFHYVAASLGFIFGIETATKLLLALGLVCTPASTYYLASQIFKKNKERLFASSFILLPVVVLPSYWGGDVKALLELGLLPSFISLPILFCYLGSLKNLAERKILLPSFLLALLVLTHIVAALVAGIILVAYLVVKILFREEFKTLFFHLGLTLLLTSFFWIPFVANSAFLSTSVHVSSLSWQNLLSLLVASFFVYIFFKSKKAFLLTISLSVWAFSLATFSDWFIERYWAGSFFYQKIYNFHLYRFQIYEFLLLTLLVTYWPAVFLFNLKKPKIKPEIVVALPVVTLLFICLSDLNNLFVTTKVNVHQVASTTGRFLETFSRAETYPFIYSAQNKLVTSEQPWAYGLFTDATPNGPYLGSLIKSLYAQQTGEKSGSFPETKVISWRKIPDILKLFAIDNMLYVDFSKPTTSKEVNFFETKVQKQDLVEIPGQDIVRVSNNWNQAVLDWWVKNSNLKTLLAFDPSGKLKVGSKAGSVEIKSHNRNWSQFKVGVNTTSGAVPVVVKFAYFPNWKATELGKEIPIYRLSPDLMLVNAKNDVTFTYQESPLQELTLLVSLFTLLGVVIYKAAAYAKIFK